MKTEQELENKSLEEKFDYIVEYHNLRNEETNKLYNSLTDEEKRKFCFYYESLLN